MEQVVFQLTVKEAAMALRLSVAKVYKMMDAKELAFVKLGKSRRIRIVDLEDLVRRNLQLAEPHVN